MWLPTFLQRGIHFFGERTEVLAFNNFILFDRIHLPIIGKRAAVVEEKAVTFAMSRHASPHGGFCFTCNAHGSLNSPACSCVSITLPASS